MTAPLYEAKADLFRILGHPMRVRVLELLVEQPMPVRDLLADIQVEPSNLSQQLGVLRRSGLVSSSRQGTTVLYSVDNPFISDLLLAGRKLLAREWTGTQELLEELGEAP